MRLGRVPGLRSRIWLLPSPPNSTPTSAEPRRPGRDTQSRRGVPRKFRRSTVQSLSDGGEQTPGARTSVAARPPRPAALPGSEDTSTRGPPSAPPLAGRARDAAGPGLRSAQSRETSLLRAGSLFSWSLPPHFLLGGPTGSRAMSRKRQRLVPETLGLKKRRERGPAGGGPERGEGRRARQWRSWCGCSPEVCSRMRCRPSHSGARCTALCRTGRRLTGSW
nr:serine/threonine-protein kinase 19 isoform X4 [Desmodus rotundus]